MAVRAPFLGVSRAHHSLAPVVFAGGCLAALALAGGGAFAQTAAPALFPRPFVVEHGIVETEPDGTTFRAPSVTDYYGGSWIVSVRPDRSRVVVDFGKREITEVRTTEGTYTVISFARLAELRERLRRAEQPIATAPASRASKAASASTPARSKPTFFFEELPLADASSARPGGPDNAAPMGTARRSVRHLRVTVQPETGGTRAAVPAPTMDVWLDPTITLEPAALAALAGFEGDTLSSKGAEGQVGAGDLRAAAQAHAGGAFPVRTSRPFPRSSGTASAGRIEDVATKLEPLPTFPLDLLTVPEGLRRIPHPMEAMVAFAEDEAARARATRGAAGK